MVTCSALANRCLDHNLWVSSLTEMWRGDGRSSSLVSLRVIKVTHTVVWAFFVGAILAVPISARLSRFDWALGLAGLVFVEVLVLAFNRMQCPLTRIAARFTADRRANFDIYLPEWIAKWNKEIFGPLYLLGLLYAAARWYGAHS